MLTKSCDEVIDAVPRANCPSLGADAQTQPIAVADGASDATIGAPLAVVTHIVEIRHIVFIS